MRRGYKGISINTTQHTHEKVYSLLSGNKKANIADIPSGHGAFVLRLKDHGYENVWALDIQNLLAFPHEKFAVADMTQKLNLPDQSLDTLVSIDGLEHIYEQNKLMQEAARVLKKGGEFIISTPNTSSIRSRIKWLLTGHHHKCDSPLDENNPNPLHHVAMLSYPELRYLLHTHGFRIETVTSNRIKLVAWFWIELWPLVAFFSYLAYRKAGKRDKTAQLNQQVLKHMLSMDVFLGETLIIKAIKF